MPTDYIRYDLLVQDALRSVVRKVLTEASKVGLQGDHHFNISFKTQAAGVVIPAQMRQRYPDEMAIILQHEFWDLQVGPDAFEVSLNFSRKPERLTIPFDAITGFSDPSVPFGFKLEPRLSAEAAAAVAAAESATAKPEATPKSEVTPLAKPARLAPAPKPAKAVDAKPADADKAEASEETKSEAKPRPEAKPGDGEAKVVSIDAFRKK